MDPHRHAGKHHGDLQRLRRVRVCPKSAGSPGAQICSQAPVSGTLPGGNGGSRPSLRTAPLPPEGAGAVAAAKAPIRPSPGPVRPGGSPPSLLAGPAAPGNGAAGNRRPLLRPQRRPAGRLLPDGLSRRGPPDSQRAPGAAPFPLGGRGLPPSRCVGYPERLLAGAAGSPILRRLRHAVFPSSGYGGPAFPAGGADGKRLFSPGKRPPVPGRPHRAPLGGKGRRTTLHPCPGGAGKAPQRPGFPPGPEPAHRLLRLPGSKPISKRPYRTLPWPGC